MRTAHELARDLGLHAPTPEQTAIIEAPLEPLLVVAGAGSGKTDTMASRVVFLLANGLVEPDRVLGLTFTRKAAGELSERARGRLRRLVSRTGPVPGVRLSAFSAPTVSTYNAYAAGLVSEHALRLGVEPSARLLGEAGRWQLAHDVVERWGADLGVDSAATTITTAVLDLAGALSEHLVAPQALRAEAERLVDALAQAPEQTPLTSPQRTLLRDVQRSVRLRAALVDLVEEFTARKRASDVVDFSDQVALAARLAREVPEVGAGERARFGVVLLDEYQDTSVAQLVLLRHLFGADSGDGVGHPVTAVGDPHQSIYGWRGASAGGLERFPDEFPRAAAGAPGGRLAGSRDGAGLAGNSRARTLALSVSWRNDVCVLDAANRLAQPLRAAADDVDGGLPVLRPRPGAGPGEVTAAYLDTMEDEARAVAEFVAERRAAVAVVRAAEHAAAMAAWRADGSVPSLRPPPEPEPATAAVLCRKRSQFPVLEAALRARGLPVEVVGIGGLLSAPEVVDLVAALEAAHDPSRGDSLMRLLTGPRARLGLADLHALADWSAEVGGPAPSRTTEPGVAREPDVVDERSIVDALDDLPRPGWRSRRGRELSPVGRERLVELAAVLRSLRGQTFLPMVDLVAEAERLLGLDIEVAVRTDVSPATARAHLDAFRSVAAAFDADDGGPLGAFLAWLGAAQVAERGLDAPVAEMDPHAVQLLTVHASKGLEWDVVAVPGLVERTFPSKPQARGWVKDHGALPTALRGDRTSLPDVDLVPSVERSVLADRVAQYLVAFDAHHLLEERRLAYVALTRARGHLLVSGSWWRDGTQPTSPSLFLTELVAGDAGVPVRVLAWAPDPAAQGGVPVRPEPAAQEDPVWPAPFPLGPGREPRIRAAAAAVAAAGAPGAADPLAVRPDDDADTADLRAVTALLLDERRRGREGRSTVALPAHLSASAVVRLAEDPAGFALQLRRPVPSSPSAVARRGTAFHTWVERFYGSAALLDVDELPGADDESVDQDVDLAVLRERFLASPWADRAPVAVEVDVETPVGDLVVRSRIDAVFAEPDGGVVVVDWKTGRPPSDPEVLRARALQLAVYRVAWARRTGMPVERVGAAFFYVATGETVRPTELPSADDLERALRAVAQRT